MAMNFAARLFTAMLMVLLFSACSRSGEDAERAKENKGAAPVEVNKSLALTAEEIKQAGIKVETIQVQAVQESITLTGGIVPNQNRIATVAPRLPGRVVSVNVAQGARVKAGQTLTVLESIELGEAHAAYLQARSEAAVADAGLARADKLVAEEIIPQKDYLRAKADAERAHAALRAAADRLKLLGVVPASAEKQSANAAYPLLAPFAGTIIEKKAVIGELAQADQALFTVADLTTVWLEADLFEKDLSKLVIGARATVTVAAYPEQAFDGKLIYMADTMDKTTRTIKARVELPNPDGKLKPGMFATAHIRSTTTAQALWVPEQAVSLVQGQPTLFIVTAKGFVPRPIETGAAVEGRVPIKAGLAPGERIVVAGTYELKARLLKSQISSED